MIILEFLFYRVVSKNIKEWLSVTALIVSGFFITLPASAQQSFVSVDRFVPHISTVPANKGHKVGLYLHEKLTNTTVQRISTGETPEGRIVLFVHGNSIPSVPDFDLSFKDYSWMAYLAEAGFDTFAMDHTGYGFSPRPMMDNPCNMDTTNQAIVMPGAIEGKCAPKYAYSLTNSGSDWDEIDSVVDYIRALRGVDRISLIGWSRGGPRTGGYAARYPYKIDKLILYAPAYQSAQSSSAPKTLPAIGTPMDIQTKQALMQDRWQSNVECENQIETGIQEAIWQSVLGFDSLGSVWSTEGVMRVRIASYWGWNKKFAGRVKAPTMILVGEQDFLLPAANDLYPDLTGTNSKVLVKMECATHFAVWEATQYKFMHEASKEWLLNGQFRGQSKGIFRQLKNNK